MMDDLHDILEGYYAKTGLPRGGDTIMVRTQLYPQESAVVVRIRVDGYEVEFEHEPDFQVPPHRCWQRQGFWSGRWKYPEYWAHPWPPL